MVFWAMRGSNPRQPGCKPGALPAELIARNADYYTDFRKKCQAFSNSFIYDGSLIGEILFAIVQSTT